jgi:hypothetical protein
VGPAVGQDHVLVSLGKTFVGAVPVTDRHRGHQVLLEPCTMRFGHGGPPAWGDLIEDPGRGASHPQISVMPGFPFHLFKDVPSRCVPMEQLLAHLALPQRVQNGLEEGRDFP